MRLISWARRIGFLYGGHNIAVRGRNARRVFLPLLRPQEIERESDLKQIERLRFGFDDVILYSHHTSGGNSYGSTLGHGATCELGRVFESSNVYVADSSLFPNAPGTNPSGTILSMAHRVARHMAQDYGH